MKGEYWCIYREDIPVGFFPYQYEASNALRWIDRGMVRKWSGNHE